MMQKKWFWVPVAMVGGLFGALLVHKMNAPRDVGEVKSHNARFPWRTNLTAVRCRAYLNARK
jgi:hypothetical protein